MLDFTKFQSDSGTPVGFVPPGYREMWSAFAKNANSLPPSADCTTGLFAREAAELNTGFKIFALTDLRSIGQRTPNPEFAYMTGQRGINGALVYLVLKTSKQALPGAHGWELVAIEAQIPAPPPPPR